MLLSYLCSSFLGNREGRSGPGDGLLTGALQGFCQARQAIKAELMNDLIWAPIH